MSLEGEIKDAKMSSFPSDFQTLIKHLKFPLYFLYKLLMSLRSKALSAATFIPAGGIWVETLKTILQNVIKQTENTLPAINLCKMLHGNNSRYLSICKLKLVEQYCK